jgi:hypothetical protein
MGDAFDRAIVELRRVQHILRRSTLSAGPDLQALTDRHREEIGKRILDLQHEQAVTKMAAGRLDQGGK